MNEKRASIVEIAAIVAAIICFLLWPFATHAGPAEQVAVAEAIVWADQHAAPKIAPDKFISADKPIGITVDAVAPVERSEPIPVTIYTAETLHGDGWCIVCNTLKFRWKNGNDRIHITWSKSTTDSATYPQIRFSGKNGLSFPADDFGNHKIPATLDDLADIVERNQPDTRSYAASGNGGSIHAADKIRMALTWWKSNIKEGTKVNFRWDRTGSQSFPLLAKGDWSMESIFGQAGRFRVSAIGSGLPIESAGFIYDVQGDSFTWQLDRITHRFGKSPLSQAGPPVQVGPLTLWTIWTVVSDIYQILHPTCDLRLGGNVTASATLTGDTMVIEFNEAPSVCIKALFTLNLSVKRIDISESLVKISFNSNVIKERSFKVD